MIAVNLFMRWLHIFSVIAAVGATVFLRLVLIPALAEIKDDARAQLMKSLAGRLRKLIHGAIGGILLSGLYNTHLLWKSSVAPYGTVYAVKVVLAVVVFLIAIFLTSSRPKWAPFQANRKKWLGVNLALAIIIVALSAVLRALHP
ncbi:MAG: hypothetical protein L0387_43480 [Acidobacteria bacterium]|nr:hypothetical protein [Acidobacteriota bacterium]MCI0628447.1 hypothetical protein [Acidobacteriota bacterium]MCI0719753.1 hypothetical protein [Acidobacteriota bacterium]